MLRVPGRLTKITERVRALPPQQRRRFLQMLGAALSAPFVPAAVRFAAHELAISEAYAQQAETATLFLEFNYRDQVDLMHVMVPPSLAKYPNPVVGVNGGELTMFAPPAELKEYPNNVFLTNDSLELAPHIDSVAMLDTGEAGIGGVHGLEACGGMRSPGRLMDGGASGLQPLWLLDGEHAAGSEELYGSVPTPATLHNYYQHQLTPTLPNGFAFKGISRSKHSCYHYGAGLPGAELDRIKSKQALYDAHGNGFDATPEGSALTQEILAAVAPPYRKNSGAGYADLQRSYDSLALGRIALELTPDEIARWSNGVPPQQCTIGDYQVVPCGLTPETSVSDGYVKAHSWEQMAFASKLLCSHRVRSIALEFDFMELDGDGVRTEYVLRTEAQQIARPLARLITDLKAAGLYDRTVIAVYTLDGSRQPGANSYGNNGKGTLLLAGGRVKGGYYGDILITGPREPGHQYAFRCPDPETGALMPAESNWDDKSKRTPSGAVWRTVMKAAGIPENLYVGRFHDSVNLTKPLDFMLKT